MRNRITKIAEKVPQTTMLPDGLYNGVWGGHIIVVKYQGKTYELETEVGVKSFDIKVIVEVKDSVATFQEISN